MISLGQDFKHGHVSLQVSSLDDLWYLSHIFSPGDLVRMKTERKIKIGEEPNIKVVRKTISLTIEVETVSLQEEQLRLKGLIREGPDDVPKASYHSFGIGIGDSFKLQKNEWPSYVKEKLQDAINNAAEAVLFVLFDREQAHFSLLRQTGIEYLTSLKQQGQGKSYDNHADSIFGDLIKTLEQYNAQLKPVGIVGASPSFWKDNIEKICPDDLRKKLVFIESTDIEKSAVHKLLSRPEVHKLLAHQRLQAEESFVERLLKQLDQELVAYGKDDVRAAGESGAIVELGVTENFLKAAREDDTYAEVDQLLKAVDSMKGKIVFVSSETPSKTIDGLGGIAGIVRWKVN